MLNITSPPLLDSTGQDIVTGLSNIVSKLDTFHIEADRVSYDNTDSGLVATDVQAAIDRVVIALDTKADKTIIATVESSNTASKNYSTGNLLIHNNILYKVTTAIAIGDTITSGTNVIETTIDEIIEALLPPKPTTDGSYYLSYIKNTNSTNYTWIPRSQWEQFRDVVRSGQASTLYPIGNQLTDTWYQSASTSYNVPWDIVHYSTDKKAYLQWHYTIPDTVAFD